MVSFLLLYLPGKASYDIEEYSFSQSTLEQVYTKLFYPSQETSKYDQKMPQSQTSHETTRKGHRTHTPTKQQDHKDKAITCTDPESFVRGGPTLTFFVCFS